jgi:mannose/fructose/N-acetylgalactosamine-specific phosphotransferase system component IIB
MPIVLYRVDERLIHGQVVVGWGGPLHADRLIVVDDDLAASPWEQELYCLGVPAEFEAQFTTVAEARDLLPEWQRNPARSIVLMRNVETLRELSRDSLLRGERVNLGGIHHAQGRRPVLPYLFLSDADAGELRRIAQNGVNLSAQDLPASRSVPLEQLLDH